MSENIFEKTRMRVKHYEKCSQEEENFIVWLYTKLVPGDTNRIIDIPMIYTEAIPMFEKTIGKEQFSEIKEYYSSKKKSNKVNEYRINGLIAKLRTIENAQYYITGYKVLIKRLADKLLNAPEGMTQLEKAKIIRMFTIVLIDGESFLEDYTIQSLFGKSKKIFDERKALENNKLPIRPEQMFNIGQAMNNTSGYFYDMLIIHFKRMNSEKEKYRNELTQLLEFAELKYDSKTELFTSVNKCMQDCTFGKVRELKQSIYKVRPTRKLDFFCDKDIITEIDLVNLWVIVKILCVCDWRTKPQTKGIDYRVISANMVLHKKQPCYELVDGFLVSDDAEADRWIELFNFVSKQEMVLKTDADGNGGILPKTEHYNAGVFSAAVRFAMEMGYLHNYSMVMRDIEVVNKLLALKDAEKNFLKLKRGKVTIAEVRTLLGINEEFEKDITQQMESKVEGVTDDVAVDSLQKIVIKFALKNGYVQSEEEVDEVLIENVFISGNEENIKKFSTGQISESQFKMKIGFENEFAEAYFNVSKIDIKKIENKLLEIKQCRKKEEIRENKLLISLYCYIVKNSIKCGPKNKLAKRNKGLKPEILEKLIS